MNLDDIIYILLLFASIAFGYFYRTIDEDQVKRKRWIGSAFGVLLIVVVSGYHTLHILFSFGVTTLLILAFDVGQSHLLSFVFMFSYLLFFRTTTYFGIPNPPGHTNLIQMVLTLKLVGLAFERNAAAKELKEEKAKEPLSTEEERRMSAIKTAYLEDVLDLNVEDVFHYSFNYIGVLTGPYFTYRTFRDYFTARYWKHVKCEQVFLQRIKWVAVYAAFFLSASYLWPISYAIEDEFYFERSVLYRLWYVWPSFFIFRMRIYIGLSLSECVCIMAGMGVYPKAFKSAPGGGPRNVVALDQPIEEQHFDFETIHNIDAESTEKCWTFREAMRSYNMCVQYWMASVVYKRFPNKKFRVLATLLVSAFWHGVYSGYYLCMLGAPFYLPIETLYDKLIRQKATGTARRCIDVVFWISKFFAFSYMGIAFLLMTMDKIWYYYNSVYHFGYVLWAVLYLVGLLMYQQERMSRRRESKGGADRSGGTVPTDNNNEPAAQKETTPLMAQQEPEESPVAGPESAQPEPARPKTE